MGSNISSGYQYSTLTSNNSNNNNSSVSGQNYGTGTSSHLLASSTFPYALGQGLGGSTGYMGGPTGLQTGSGMGYSNTGIGGVGSNYNLGVGLGSGLGGSGLGSGSGLGGVSHQYQQLPSQGSLSSLWSEGQGLGRFGFGFPSGDYNNNNSSSSSSSNYNSSSYNNNNNSGNISTNPFVMRRSQAAVDVELAGVSPPHQCCSLSTCPIIISSQYIFSSHLITHPVNIIPSQALLLKKLSWID